MEDTAAGVRGDGGLVIGADAFEAGGAATLLHLGEPFAEGAEEVDRGDAFGIDHEAFALGEEVAELAIEGGELRGDGGIMEGALEDEGDGAMRGRRWPGPAVTCRPGWPTARR